MNEITRLTNEANAEGLPATIRARALRGLAERGSGDIDSHVKRIELLLAAHAESEGCEPVFGGHAADCRCFTLRVYLAGATKARDYA